MSSKPRLQPAPSVDRYAGIGGIYVIVDGERFPADESGRPLPHTRNPDGSLIEPDIGAAAEDLE